jgi:hypothetical protein
VTMQVAQFAGDSQGFRYLATALPWEPTVPKVMGNDTADWHMRKGGCPISLIFR